MMQAFIERQFPVSKVSKESYKERKANNGQTLTGLGKWWGRKPLVLVRAAILGCLLPVTDNPDKDMEIFLKIMSMDEEGLLLRKEKRFTISELYNVVRSNRRLASKYFNWFIEDNGKIILDTGAPRAEIEEAAFLSFGYDERIAMCKRPEQLENISDQAWQEINNHLDTNAHNLPELINQLSIKRFGHNVKVGDCFSGGGSIPFEASRIGCDAYGSDLNPIAGLLTWADIELCGLEQSELSKVKSFQQAVFSHVQAEIDEAGVEKNELGEKAVSYLYCTEVVCPDCGYRIPVAPNWIIGKGTKTVAIWHEQEGDYTVEVKMNASKEEMKHAEKGSATSRGFLCMHCGITTPYPVLRHDTVDSNGNVVFGLRQWGKSDVISKETDVFQERLYAVKYEKASGKRYYRAPNEHDIANEKKILSIITRSFESWQAAGYIPDMAIERGIKTDELLKNRGWC